LTLQNVRVWGESFTRAAADKANFCHEAWAEAVLSGTLSLKMGRQEIVYDDHRIFGNVGWAQQARSHDAFVAKFTPNAHNRIDIGLAMNFDKQAIVDQLYSNAAGTRIFNMPGITGSLTNGY